MGVLSSVVDAVFGKSPVQEDPLFKYRQGEAGQVPGTGNVAQAYLQGKQLYGNALIKYNQERTSTAQGFGYQGDIDPTTGVMTNLRVDQTNPYGAYQMNRRAHADQWDALRQQNASRRIGGKGLGAQAQSDARFVWGGEDAAQAQDFIGRLAGIDQGQQQAYQGWQDTYWNALAQQTRDAIEQQRFDQAMARGSEEDYAGSTGGGATTKAAAYPTSGPAWGPAPSAAMKKIIAGIQKVPAKAPVKSPSTTLTPAKTAALNAAIRAASKKKK
jgi:hypothetical protein